MVILTHGDSDHFGGLNDVLKTYKVDNFFTNGYLDSQVEQKLVQKNKPNDILSIGLFNFEVVWPDQKQKRG